MGDDQVFIDNLIPNYYEPVGTNYRNAYERGQICWVHVNYADEDLKIWRPSGLDESQTTVNSFKPENAPGDAFNRGFPLYIPPLEMHEEFVVVKAKRRPVIILSPAPADPAIRGLRQRGRIYRPICNVAPVFSLTDRITGNPKYSITFVERIRLMNYLEFFYLPPGGPIRTDSYARLCEMQAGSSLIWIQRILNCAPMF